PRSAISKYCPECRKRIRKVQGTETKRRSRERNRQACIELSAKNDRLMFIKDGVVFHQLYRGKSDDQELYQKITDTLSMLRRGGER
ncbi:MAG: hypothetical protein U0L07_03070, partial [Clostridia bacterium]|nr:hypothetical protein [Clostridia bacterium]